MPHWARAAEITRTYAVGEAKLLEFSARGNLPCRQTPGGVQFDLDFVARLFRPRSAADGGNHNLTDATSFGTLGDIKLGERHTAGPSEPRR